MGDYATLLSACGVERARIRPVVHGVRPVLVAMEAGLDPRHYCFGAFYLIGFHAPPTWPYLCSLETAWRVRRAEGEVMAAWADWAARQTPAFDPHLDLSHYGEAIRSRMDPATCLQAIRDTGGYHPGSRVCRTCPAAGDCRAFLISWTGADLGYLRGIDRNQALAILRAAYPTYPLTPMTAA